MKTVVFSEMRICSVPCDVNKMSMDIHGCFSSEPFVAAAHNHLTTAQAGTSRSAGESSAEKPVLWVLW